MIKDTPFDASQLKSKRRYEINKGNKNFEVRLIKPSEMVADVYRVTVSAYKGWPEKYRPAVTEKQISESVKQWDNALVFGAFLRENGILQGYAIVEDYKNYAAFSILRTNPETERLGINAAIVDGILSELKDRFHDGFYICDGSRAIRHETFFQDYLEKYFDFRKAFCKLNIRYKPGFGMIVKVLYPFRSLIGENSGISSKISGILKMEEICRNKQ